jgi:hypothetical protein
MLKDPADAKGYEGGQVGGVGLAEASTQDDHNQHNLRASHTCSSSSSNRKLNLTEQQQATLQHIWTEP